jgi:hypothetical protein
VVVVCAFAGRDFRAGRYSRPFRFGWAGAIGLRATKWRSFILLFLVLAYVSLCFV